eukprot:TRINITY_DN1491_c0_g1_i5.p1 TRINITY_DN1491_c0_g1~~TRINITY_DN1491_c0_g1_i5.p1  ORF type:complete len:113 (-),score=11.24 TRINITY_DN1491_c0_g1_i5:194-532(-)
MLVVLHHIKLCPLVISWNCTNRLASRSMPPSTTDLVLKKLDISPIAPATLKKVPAVLLQKCNTYFGDTSPKSPQFPPWSNFQTNPLEQCRPNCYSLLQHSPKVSLPSCELLH